MTNFTRDGMPLTRDQFIALYTFHCIFGVDFEPWADEANEIDWKLIENAEFMRDMFVIEYVRDTIKKQFNINQETTTDTELAIMKDYQEEKIAYNEFEARLKEEYSQRVGK